MSAPLDPREPPRPLPRPIPIAPPGAMAPRPRTPQPEPPPAPLSPQIRLAMAIIAGTTAAVMLALCGGVFVLAFSLAQEREGVATSSNGPPKVGATGSNTRPGRPARDTSGGAPFTSSGVRDNWPPTVVDPDASLTPYERHLKWLEGYDSQKARTAAEWFAAQRKDRVQQTEVEAALLESLSRGDRENRLAVLDALQVWGDQSIIPKLTIFAKRYRDEAPQTIELIARFDSPEATSALVELLREREPIGAAAAQALQRRPEQIKPRLAGLLLDRDRRLREAAAALVTAMEVTDDELAPAMRAELTSDEGQRRFAALEWFSQAQVSDEQRDAILTALVPLLRDSDFRVPEAAMKALVADRSAASSDALLQALDEEVGPWALALPELLEREDERVVPRLEKLLKNPQTSGRCMVATRKVTEGEPIIRKLLQSSKDPLVVRNTLLFYKHLMNRDTLPTLQLLQQGTGGLDDTSVRGFAQSAIDHVNALPRE